MVAMLAFANNWPAGSAAVNAFMGSTGGRALRWENRVLVKAFGWELRNLQSQLVRWTKPLQRVQGRRTKDLSWKSSGGPLGNFAF